MSDKPETMPEEAVAEEGKIVIHVKMHGKTFGDFRRFSKAQTADDLYDVLGRWIDIDPDNIPLDQVAEVFRSIRDAVMERFTAKN